jgi:hypothetical protein
VAHDKLFRLFPRAIQRYSSLRLRRQLISQRTSERTTLIFRGTPRPSANLSHEMTTAHDSLSHLCGNMVPRVLRTWARDVSLNGRHMKMTRFLSTAVHIKGRFVEGYTCFGENRTACRERMVRDSFQATSHEPSCRTGCGVGRPNTLPGRVSVRSASDRGRSGFHVYDTYERQAWNDRERM